MRMEGEDQARRMLHCRMTGGDAVTGFRVRAVSIAVGLVWTAWAVGQAQVPRVSPQQADAFMQKVERIQQHADSGTKASPHRTTLTEVEVHSWFTYHAPPLLPDGIARPRVSILGNRRMTGTAIVDLDAVAKERQSGSLFDVWNFVGGRLPVTVTGLLHTSAGRARFEMQEADISGVPVPMRVLDELVRYYSRTPDDPSGVRLTDTFELPAGITHLELRPGSAIVVQ
jgi:hypothetical protein